MDVPEEDNNQIAKRKAIQAIMKDASLTPAEKQSKIQQYMASGGGKTESSNNNPPASNEASPAPPAVEPSSTDAPTTFSSRQDRMKSIMRDTSLTPQEKQKRIQEIMAAGDQPETQTQTQQQESSAVAAVASSDPAAEKIHKEDSVPVRRKASNARPRMPTMNASSSSAATAAAVGASVAAASSDPASGKAADDVPTRRRTAASARASASVSRGVPAPADAAGTATPTTSRQELMQSVMQDTTLSPQEKQARIQEIMSGGGATASSSPAAAAAAAEQTGNIREVSQGQEQEQPETVPQTTVAEDQASQPRASSERSRAIIDDPEFQAFVPGQEDDTNNDGAVVATDIVTQDEAEEEEELRKRRYFCRGIGCLCILLIAVIVPIVVLVPQDAVPTPKETDSPTETPSSSPTTAALLDLLTELETNIYPDQEMYQKAFANEGTPQYQAAIWATGQANTEGLSGTDPRMISRYALATFYFATSGDNWYRCSRDGSSCSAGEEWLLADNECDWYSITCGDNYIVERINFGIGGKGDNIAGTLPFEISLLSGLKSLVIRQNALEGTIPDSWTDLTTLELVSLGLNELTGTLPESLINNNPNLRTLFLEDNKLSGGLPLSPVSNALTQLKLNGNNLEGPIPSGFSGLAVLQRLFLEENNLSGSIPSSISQMSFLSELYLANNNLNDTLPEGFFDLTNLFKVNLNGNNLQGTISDKIGGFSKLQELDFSENSFSGTLPEAFGDLASNKLEIMLNNNQFSGPIPAGFQLLTNLRTLTLYENNLTGSVSPELCALKGSNYWNLQYISVDCAEVSCDCCDDC